jgi:hypothetical protein
MNDKTIKTKAQGVVKALGLAFLIWLFGLLIFIPLAQPENIPQSIIALIILIPVAALLFTGIPSLRDFAHAAGEAQHKRRETWVDSPQPFIHFWYAIWLIVGGILLIPLLYMISAIFGGIAFFAVLAGIAYLALINFMYIGEMFTRYLKPLQEGQQQQQQQQKPQGQ